MKRLILIYFLLIYKFSFTQIDYKGFPEWSWHKQDSTEYYLYTPAVIKSGTLYPIALFLHGCCGESYHATLRNTVDPPVRMWHNFGANTQKVPTYIIAPATSRGWKQHIPNLKKVIDSLIQFEHGDPRRVYITGFSMGGQGTWEFLQQYPGLFAAAIPMGMNFHGDHAKIKDIPIWALRGSTDYWANRLHDDVWKIRKLNGVETDSTDNLVMGVNPRFTSFGGYGHGVQWIAASTMNLTDWAYSKVNDGNKYPVIHFVEENAGRLRLYAADPGGTISKIVIRIDGKQHSVLRKEPYKFKIPANTGNVLEAVAYDNKNKTNTATYILKSAELVSNARNKPGIKLPVAALKVGAKVHFDNQDDEITVSDPSVYKGYALILTSNRDTTENEVEYLFFDINKDAGVYVAYEKKDKLFKSGIPSWLAGWEKMNAKQIVTQYFYYDVYFKRFKKGRVILPSPDRKASNVNNNYFVLVR